MYTEFSSQHVFSITTLSAGCMLWVTNILFTQSAQPSLKTQLTTQLTKVLCVEKGPDAVAYRLNPRQLGTSLANYFNGPCYHKNV